MKKQIIVLGYYGHNNAGDLLFKSTFQELFHEYNLVFVEKLSKALLENASALFIGGGSFLDQSIKFEDSFSVVDLVLLDLPIFYLSIGIEGSIHPDHLLLLGKSKLTYVRNENTISSDWKSKLPNLEFAPDVVYAAKRSMLWTADISKVTNKILMIPNLHMVPDHSSAHWKHASWGYFKSEFSQFTESIPGVTVDYLSISEDGAISDSAAAYELRNASVSRQGDVLISSFKEHSLMSHLVSTMRRYDCVFSQRLHGSIVAQIAGVPYVSISHHSKLDMMENKLSYYGLTKSQLIQKYKDKKVVIGSDPSSIFKIIKKVKEFVGT